MVSVRVGHPLLLVGAVALVTVAAGCIGAPRATAASRGTSHATPPRLISRPDLHPPVVRTRWTAGAPQGDVLLTARWEDRGQPGLEIITTSGRLVWFHPAPHGLMVADLKVSDFGGRPVLLWWQGRPWRGHGKGECVIMSTHYKVLAVVPGAPGLPADLHECHLTRQGTVIVDSYIAATADLRPYGGPAHGRVYDGVAEEIDPRTGRLLARWDSVEHIPVTDSMFRPPRSGQRWDYFHINSIKPAPDGTWVISARDTNAVYDVDPHSGRVIWRLGGRHSDFEMGPGTRFAYQHDAVWHRDGTITIYDDQSPPAHGRARGLTLRLTFTAAGRPLRATVVHQYLQPHARVVHGQGSMQRLDAGGAFVGWGRALEDSSAFDAFSAFDGHGRLVLDGLLPRDARSYRAYPADWHASPASRPALVAHRGRHVVRLYTSWNGATEVTAWRALTGPSPHELRVTRTVSSQGFETAFNVPRAAEVAQVQALDAAGRILRTSRTVRVRPAH